MYVGHAVSRAYIQVTYRKMPEVNIGSDVLSYQLNEL